MIAIALTIPENEFGNKAISRNEMVDFFQRVESKLQDNFPDLETEDVLPMQEPVPLFHEKETFFFFYGALDRPHEYWKQLLEMTEPSTDPVHEVQKSLNEEIKKDLRWQTNIIQAMYGFPEFTNTYEEMYVPGELFLNTVSKWMIQTAQSEEPAILPGAFEGWAEPHLLQEAPYVLEKLKHRKIKIGDSHIRLFPQSAYRYHCSRLLAAIRTDDDLPQVLNLGFFFRLEHTCLQYFKGHRRIGGIVEHPSNRPLLDPVGLNFQFDDNKIFVFSFLRHVPGRPVHELVQQRKTELEGYLRNINTLDTIGIRKREGLYGMVRDKLEWITIYVFENLHDYVMLPDPATEGFRLSWLVEYKDLQPIFAELSDPLAIYKFIEEENWLRNTYRISLGSDQMERFRFFLANGRSYSRIAKIEDVTISFTGNDWGAYYHDNILQRYSAQPELYENISRHYGDHFDRVKHYKGNAYHLISSVFFQDIYVVNLPGRFIPVWLPEDPFLVDRNAYRVGFDVLATMFADFISALDSRFVSLLDDAGADQYMLAVYPLEYVRKSDKIAAPEEELVKLSETTPVLYYPVYKKYNRLVTYLVYDHRYVHSLFAAEDNEGERNLLRGLLSSIPYNTTDVTDVLVDAVLPKGPKGYGIDRISINTDIEDYKEPSETTGTDRGRVKRIIADYLKATQIEEKDYTGEPAKDLIYKMYLHLQEYLENELSKYSEPIIVYAYQQYEYNEGKVEKHKMMTGMHAGRRRDYDVKKSVSKEYSQRQSVSTVVRFILHTCIKVKPVGTKIINEADWTFLLAVAEQLIHFGTIWDHIDYDLEIAEITVTPFYELTDKMSPGKMQFAELHAKETDQRMGYAVTAFQKANEPEEKSQTVEPDLSNEIRNLLDVFETTYGVSFELVLGLITILSRHEFTTAERDFPVYIATQDEMEKILLAHTINSSIEQIRKAIDFLTITYGAFEKKDWVYHEILLRRPERLTLRPLIRLNDGAILFGREVVDGSSYIWKDLFTGRAPYPVIKNSEIDKALGAIRTAQGLAFEKECEAIANECLGEQYVEGRIDNFKRLSPTFKSKEPCGEIDILCVNIQTKTIFVIDCKCLNKDVGLYQVRQNIREFYHPKDGYHRHLLDKKKFVTDNLSVVLTHFTITDATGWMVKEAFVVSRIQFAGFYEGKEIDFLLPQEFAAFLNINTN